MKHSLTNRALGVGGDANTTSVTVRLPADVVAYVDSHLNGRIKNRSEFLQHWAQVGVRVSMDDELTEALDWALDQSVQEPPTLDPKPEDGKPGDLVPVGFVDDPVGYKVLGASVPDPEQPLTELGQIRAAQLEALRSRVK